MSLWERAWGSLCDLGQDLVKEQQRLVTELQRVETECKYDDTAIISAMEGLVATTYKHDEDIKMIQNATGDLQHKAQRAFEELRRKASTKELADAEEALHKQVGAVGNEVSKRVRQDDFESTIQTLQDETANLFEQLEENGSEELQEEKARVDGLVQSLKRLIDEKTAISANAATTSAYACLACNQQVPMMPPPKLDTSIPPQTVAPAQSPRQALRGNSPPRAMTGRRPLGRANTAQPGSRGVSQVQLGTVGTGYVAMPPSTPRLEGGQEVPERGVSRLALMTPDSWAHGGLSRPSTAGHLPEARPLTGDSRPMTAESRPMTGDTGSTTKPVVQGDFDYHAQAHCSTH